MGIRGKGLMRDEPGSDLIDLVGDECGEEAVTVSEAMDNGVDGGYK